MTRKALVLDFGGVVLKTPFELLENLERRHAVPPGTYAWRGPFAPDSDALWQAMQRDEISEREYWAMRAAEVGRATGRDGLDTRAMMVDVFACDEDDFVRPEAREAIAATRAAGLPVAILTNDLAAFHGPGWFSALRLAPDIALVVDGSLTGVLKPDPAIYADVLTRLEIDAPDAVFVDDQARNVAGAERAGMRAIHFDVTSPRESFDRARAELGILAGPRTRTPKV